MRSLFSCDLCLNYLLETQKFYKIDKIRVFEKLELDQTWNCRKNSSQKLGNWSLISRLNLMIIELNMCWNWNSNWIKYVFYFLGNYIECNIFSRKETIFQLHLQSSKYAWWCHGPRGTFRNSCTHLSSGLWRLQLQFWEWVCENPWSVDFAFRVLSLETLEKQLLLFL